MSKNQSLATALKGFDRTNGPAPIQQVSSKSQVKSISVEKSKSSTQAPSRQGKKALIGYFDPDVSKQLKQLALDQDSNIQELLREALNDLFQKHKKPTIA